MFLDVQMPACSGVEVVRSLAAPRPRIVFCTSFDEYAVEAFELHVIDYLLKPVTRARLAQTVARLQREPPPTTTPPSRARRALATPRASSPARARATAWWPRRTFSAFPWSTASPRLTPAASASGWTRRSTTSKAASTRRTSSASLGRPSCGLDAIVEVATLVGGYGEVLLRNGAKLQVSRRRLRELLNRLGGAAGPS